MSREEAIPNELLEMPPVTHRHAKCKNCGARFAYWRGATEDNGGVRPECPRCDEQGIGGPFGRRTPAEYLGIATMAAQDAEYEYRHWLANEAVIHVDREEGEEWVYVLRKDSIPCAVTFTLSRTEDGAKLSRRSAWKPGTYWDYIKHGVVSVDLVSIDDAPGRVQQAVDGNE